jgi:hypothetical protein
MRNFMNPENAYRIYPILHGLAQDGDAVRLEKDIQHSILDTFAGGTVTNVRWTPEWVTDPENIRFLESTMEAVRANDLGVWIYDEYWYPSGWANGYAIRKHPENAARNIAFLSKTGLGREAVRVSLPDHAFYFVAAACYPRCGESYDFTRPSKLVFTDSAVTGSTPDGEWLLMAFYIRPHNVSHGEGQQPEKLPGGYREILNFLNKPAVDAYIEAALQPLSDGIPTFSESTEAIFTDEPSLMSMYYCNTDWTRSFDSVPWGDTLFHDFKDRYGYALTDVLPYLFFDDSEQAKTVRVQYYRLLSDLMVDNFTANVANWCHRHQVKYSGHLLLEEATYYHVGYYADFMKTMSGLDIPGFDILTADSRKFWKKGNAFGSSWCFAGKYASSVSRIKGHNLTMLEICPFIDTEVFQKNPYEEFMALMTYCTFIGATHINAYSYDSITNPEEYKSWNDYTARLVCMLRDAVSNCRIAVYYPIADAQAAFTATGLNLRGISKRSYGLNDILENMTYAIYENQMDYNFLNEDALLSAAFENGCITLNGIPYDVLLMPSITVIPLSVMRHLEMFRQQGGRVLFIGDIPQMGISSEEHEMVRTLAKSLCTKDTCVSDTDFTSLITKLKHMQNASMTVSGEHIMASHYRLDGKDLVYIINTDSQPTQAMVSGDGEAALYQPQTGEIETVKLPLTVTLDSGRGVFLQK